MGLALQKKTLSLSLAQPPDLARAIQLAVFGAKKYKKPGIQFEAGAEVSDNSARVTARLLEKRPIWCGEALRNDLATLLN